ncbi:MAG: peptide chain release factor N(5)-glutamine methyltransferase [Bacilli bacterium]
MPTNRQIYFNLLKSGNKYLTRFVIKSLLCDVNKFNDDITLYKSFDFQCLNYDRLLENIKRVCGGEPFQYVLGYCNFIDRYYEVNPHVLIPRQETEELVVNAKALIEKAFGKSIISVADICTGSGCIAVALKKYFPLAHIYATDIDKECLIVAKKNDYSKQVTFLQGDMLEPLIKQNIQIDIIICNPPYIEKKEEIDEQVWKYEPHLALLAYPDTFFYEKVFKNCDKILSPQGMMIFEIGEDMEEKLTELIAKYLHDVVVKFSKDMHNKTRFLYIIKKGDNNYA